MRAMILMIAKVRSNICISRRHLSKKKKIVLVEGGARRRAKSRGMWAEVVKILTAYNFSIGSA